MPNRIRKRVKDLLPGDVIVQKDNLRGRWQDRARILSTPKESIYGPTGRLEVIVWYNGSDEPTVRYWDRMAMMTTRGE